ncbi:hypothetical protein FF38_11457, partial [Lucilia cuprina]
MKRPYQQCRARQRARWFTFGGIMLPAVLMIGLSPTLDSVLIASVYGGLSAWYGELLRAIEHLERQGVTCLAPRYEEIKVVRGRKKKVMEPLFPNYIFVKFEYETIHFSTISATRGVSHFVRFGREPVVVPDGVIATLVVPNLMKDVTEQLPEKGQAVVLHGGIYEGIKAIYSEPDGDK